MTPEVRQLARAVAAQPPAEGRISSPPGRSGERFAEDEFCRLVGEEQGSGVDLAEALVEMLRLLVRHRRSEYQVVTSGELEFLHAAAKAVPTTWPRRLGRLGRRREPRDRRR